MMSVRCVPWATATCNRSSLAPQDKMWERACSRMRWISQYIYWLTHRIREQARSHIRFVSFSILHSS
ncbi:hypothetical protein FFI16_021165 [Pseudomonas sp. KBS0710]|nr:hypothetical protein FFI16_021165 [Pseudomonas sp. KBS0710]